MAENKQRESERSNVTSSSPKASQLGEGNAKK
jgi:hypothetical protein